MLPTSVKRLIEQLSSLPGIGQKTAERLALHLLRRNKENLSVFGDSISTVKDGITYCPVCHNFTESSPCAICQNHSRDQHLLCVVEGPLDAAAIERTGDFSGRYHVLHGVISPIDGLGPEHIKLKQLIDRAQSDTTITEIIVATNPSLEGEATASYIKRALSNIERISVTRIALGLPMGGDLEYADEITIGNALRGRKQM